MPPGEIFSATALTEDQLLKQSEIMAMRQIADTMGAMQRTLEQTRDKVEDVKGRVIRLEERNEQVERLRTEQTETKAALDRACDRINALESDRDQRAGAMKGLAFFKDYAGWMAAIIVGLIAYVGSKLKP